MDAFSIVGCILGTAVGDALGLPYEGLSKQRGVRLLGEPTRYRFFRGCGMVSDDTEHTCLVAEALIASKLDPERFTQELATGLRGWLFTIPPGIGFATLRATIKLCLGFGPERSGVFSAGNGPAMRSAILGAGVEDLELLRELVRRQTRMTHTDPRAEHGALAVAVAARLSRKPGPVSGNEYFETLRDLLPEETAADLLQKIERAVRSAAVGEATTSFATGLGLQKGVTGFVNHTVPVAIHSWLRHHHDLRTGLREVIRCSGDTDSTAAIVGGLIGSHVGRDGIPKELLTGLREWPMTVAWMQELSVDLAAVIAGNPCDRVACLPFAGRLGRNIFFLVVVVAHVLRRMLPPYCWASGLETRVS